MTDIEHDDRLSIMIHDGGLTEEEARAILEQRQGELWERKGDRDT